MFFRSLWIHTARGASGSAHCGENQPAWGHLDESRASTPLRGSTRPVDLSSTLDRGAGGLDLAAARFALSSVHWATPRPRKTAYLFRDHSGSGGYLLGKKELDLAPSWRPSSPCVRGASACVVVHASVPRTRHTHDGRERCQCAAYWSQSERQPRALVSEKEEGAGYTDVDSPAEAVAVATAHR